MDLGLLRVNGYWVVYFQTAAKETFKAKEPMRFYLISVMSGNIFEDGQDKVVSGLF